MCCLFGLMDCRGTLTARQRTRILEPLAVACELRGTDATGIAYNAGGKLHIRKKPLPAHKLRLRLPEEARVVMGHTRMATQGSAERLCNNHPFPGIVPGTRFALAHNGVLHNDDTLRRTRKLPNTRIETDSYVAVQLIEQKKALSFSSLKYMAESVEGSFTFTVLDQGNTLYFIKGDNPLCLYHYPGPGLFLYASTREILELGLQGTWLSKEKKEEIPVTDGEILKLSPDGSRTVDTFRMPEPDWTALPFRRRHRATVPQTPTAEERAYLRELKSVAAAWGYAPWEIDALLARGFTTDEIEEVLYEQEW